MKKAITISFFAGIVLALSSCNFIARHSSDFQTMEAEKDSIINVLALTTQQTNEYLAIIAEIEHNLEQVQIAQGYITFDQAEGGADSRERIQNNINLINQLLEENRLRIEQLENENTEIARQWQGRVNALRRQMTALETEIAELRLQIEEREGIIAERDSAIVVLHENIVDLQVEKELIGSVVMEQDEVLHTAFFFFGTNRELRDRGIDIGRRSVNRANFTRIDIREARTFDLQTRRADVLSQHPSGSYRIRVENNNATLEITNPAEFWSITRYLVVRTR